MKAREIETGIERTPIDRRTDWKKKKQLQKIEQQGLKVAFQQGCVCSSRVMVQLFLGWLHYLDWATISGMKVKVTNWSFDRILDQSTNKRTQALQPYGKIPCLIYGCSSRAWVGQAVMKLKRADLHLPWKMDLTGRPRAICGQWYPLPCFAWLWIGVRGSRAAAPKGTKSCRTQGDFRPTWKCWWDANISWLKA